MKMSLFITSLLICLLFQKGLAIKCIACSTEQDPKCASTYTGNKEEDLIECRDTVTACLTMIEEHQKFLRVCAENIYLIACEQDYVVSCEQCSDRDGCNVVVKYVDPEEEANTEDGSNNLRTSTVLVWLVPVLVAILNTRVGVNKHS